MLNTVKIEQQRKYKDGCKKKHRQIINNCFSRHNREKLGRFYHKRKIDTKEGITHDK